MRLMHEYRGGPAPDPRLAAGAMCHVISDDPVIAFLRSRFAQGAAYERAHLGSSTCSRPLIDPVRRCCLCFPLCSFRRQAKEWVDALGPDRSSEEGVPTPNPNSPLDLREVSVSSGNELALTGLAHSPSSSLFTRAFLCAFQQSTRGTSSPWPANSFHLVAIVLNQLVTYASLHDTGVFYLDGQRQPQATQQQQQQQQWQTRQPRSPRRAVGASQRRVLCCAVLTSVSLCCAPRRCAARCCVPLSSLCAARRSSPDGQLWRICSAWCIRRLACRAVSCAPISTDCSSWAAPPRARPRPRMAATSCRLGLRLRRPNSATRSSPSIKVRRASNQLLC